MMNVIKKAIVIEAFNDAKNDGKFMEPGDKMELSIGRFEELKAKGKVKELIEKKEVKEKENKEEE